MFKFGVKEKSIIQVNQAMKEEKRNWEQSNQYFLFKSRKKCQFLS